MTAQAQPERDLLERILGLAGGYGWVASYRPDTCEAQETVPTGAGADAGFPNLVLLQPRHGRLVFAAVTNPGGRVTGEQAVWLDGLARVAERSWDAVRVVAWCPSDWDEIRRVLTWRPTVDVHPGGEVL
jgi:hypothetical protein